MRHIAAVLRGRPAELVALALRRIGREGAHPSLSDVASAESFQGTVKQIVQDAVDTVSGHWSARLSVHLWDRLEL